MPGKSKKKGRITIDTGLCKGCYLCISVCPKQLIGVSDSLNQKGYYPARFLDSDNEDGRQCTGCANCAVICPDVSIEVYRG